MAETMSVTERQEHWRGVVEQWRQSGQKQAAFCRERGVPVWRFRYWFQRMAAGSAGSGAVFARVRRVGGCGLRLRVGALELEVEPGFDEQTLRRLLRTLRATC